ncbi:MAG: TonB-dependent receptor [Asticcacaulis sp.]|uniref:TonB-dependent receptor n=1 Tax=Asticcacaulis sp. TaxID=1872648 RepID=UPI003F7C449F
MKKTVHTTGARTRLTSGTALGLVALFAVSTLAHAQTAETSNANTAAQTQSLTDAKKKAAADDSTLVIVTGVRASQRSSIDRKKHAATATDSIVAEDIGQFPDKNVNEAISRIAGVSLDRGDNGEGQGFSIRGQGMDTTLVDVDGMSTLNTGGGIAGGAGSADGGRGADLRELPADMVKSIDVIKGSTAAMTEGGLGGSVHIETRTGLDFKKPFFQLTVDEQMNSISKQWTPEWSAVFARQFFGGRLGMTGNIDYSETQTNADAQQPQTSGNAGPARNADFDQSADKTFTYDPSIVDPTASAGNFRVLNSNGSALYSSASPIDILSKSAAAATKQDCYAAFPALTSAQLAAVPSGDNVLGTVSSSGVSASNNAKAAQLEQANELATCLNQWNDYAPSLVRYFSKRAYERRLAAQLRFDYKVNDDLTLYITGNIRNRTVDNRDDTLNLGSPGYNQGNVCIQGVCNTASSQGTVASTSNTYITPRTVATGLGYGFYDNGLCATTVTGTGTAQKTTGCGVESDITNAVVDASHHLTSFTLNDANANIDAIHYHTLITSWGAQVGGHYHHDNVKLDFFYGDSGSTWQQAQIRTAVNYTYGSVNMHVTPSGLWTYDLPSGFDLASLPYSNVNSAVSYKAGAATALQSGAPNAYTAAQSAMWGTNFSITMRPRMSDDAEKQLKLDLKYDFENKIPFIQDVQWGLQTRNHHGDGWGYGGYQEHIGSGVANTTYDTVPYSNGSYVAPVYVPSEALGVTYRSCLPQGAGTGYQSCDYGYAPNTVVGSNNQPVGNLSALGGVMTMTPSDLNTLIQSALYTRGYTYMGDYAQKGDVLGSWPLINPDVIEKAIPGYQDIFNLSCMKTCKANDGTVYSQPHFAFHEKTQAMYLMFDFDQQLPWYGMEFNGNVGTRMVRTDVQATGFMTLAHTAVNAGWDPVLHNGDVTTTTAALNTSINNETTDWLPSYNLNLWILPNKLVARYYSGHVVSRPAPAALLPSGTCTIDERNQADINDTLSADGTNNCSGRIGNPALKPYKAINHNESLEWYPNKDFNVSLAYFYNNVIIGKPIAANLPAQNFFQGSTATDPVTGKPFSNYDFNVPSYVNGPGGLQRGIEFSTKIAFTALPWQLKYFGIDYNYTKMSTANFQVTQDLITGAYNPPQYQRAFTQNATLWYDDGRLNMRLSWQTQAGYFDFISSCSNALNNYPTAFPQCSGQTIRTPYNPGGTNFRDKTGFLDAKINYKIRKDLEVFFQGRNIGRALTYREIQPYNTYSDGTPTLENISYGGARWEVGFTYRN